MVANRLERHYRRMGLAESFLPPEDLRQAQAAKQVFDQTGALFQDKLPPTVDALTWDPTETGWKPALRAGTVTMIRVRCTTAPTTGDATVEVTMETPTGGADVIATVVIPQGERFADASPMVAYPATAWFNSAVGVANGATGVSIGVMLST